MIEGVGVELGLHEYVVAVAQRSQILEPAGVVRNGSQVDYTPAVECEGSDDERSSLDSILCLLGENAHNNANQVPEKGY